MKTALVTGSSRGIGLAIARRLVQCDWRVHLHGSKDSDDLRQAARELRESCAGIHVADLVNPEEVQRLAEEVLRSGKLDALVNNAGVYRPVSFIEATAEDFEANLRQTFEINFFSPLRLTRHFVKHFVEAGSGKILNIASRVGFKGEPGATTYSASKAALINVTRGLAVELAPRGIGVFGVAPGWVETAMAREGMETRLDQILRDIPLGRMASPNDCAATVAFLLSDEAAYLSGVVIDINGASYFH